MVQLFSAGFFLVPVTSLLAPLLLVPAFASAAAAPSPLTSGLCPATRQQAGCFPLELGSGERRRQGRERREKQLQSCLQQRPSVDECWIQRFPEKQAMLPFQTLQEAEASLGRPLTFAETLWFNYSARMPDFLLYFHNFLFLLCVFSLCPLPVVLVELKGPKFLDRFKIQPKIKTPTHVILKCYKDVMVVFLLVVGPLQFSSYPLIKWVGIRMGLPLPSVWEILAQLLVYFMVEDYGNYWLHRWMHGKWGYEKIHHVHHEFTAPIGFAAPYAHWAEVLVLGIPAFVGPAIVPGHIVTFWLWIALRQMEAIETHSGYDFPCSLTKFIPFYGGAEYHDYHHYVGGQSQSNFASVFTYCDYIYGTDKGYRYHRYQKAHLEKMKGISYGEINGESNKVDQDPKSQ